MERLKGVAASVVMRTWPASWQATESTQPSWTTQIPQAQDPAVVRQLSRENRSVMTRPLQGAG